MAYTAEYESSDLTAAIIDMGVTIAAGLVTFAALVGLVLVYRWFKKSKMRI